MIIYTVEARKGTHSYVVGVFLDETTAKEVALREEDANLGAYRCVVKKWKTEGTITLEEKVMRLQEALIIVIDKIGGDEATRLIEYVGEGYER